ncbi:MAG TPA: DUF4148 domain-containing protein [Rhizobacter sp.]
MNRKQALTAAAIALFGSSAAFAQNSEIELQHFGANQASTVSRADVRAEVLQAQAAGELTVPGEVVAAGVPARSNGLAATRLTRAQVQSELAGADLTTPAEVVAWTNPTGSTLSREAVRAEARAQARVDTYQDKARIGAGF